MTLQLTHVLYDRVKLHFAGQPLLDYVFVSRADTFESPRPYFCPIYTLAGDDITSFRPHDHPWHVGLSMTWAYLNEQNFWGGNTYVHGEGYQALDNVGQTKHISWNQVACGLNQAHLDHNLHWITQAGDVWLSERRIIDISTEEASNGEWSITLHMTFQNVSGELIQIGSPMTRGRPLAGYGGLFWRGPRSFTGATLFSAEQDGEDIVTHPNEWVAFLGQHDGTGNYSTVIFIDSPLNPRYPTKWWGRSEQFACVSSSFVYDEVYELRPDAELRLSYQIVICNGEHNRHEVGQIVQRYTKDTESRNSVM